MEGEERKAKERKGREGKNITPQDTIRTGRAKVLQTRLETFLIPGETLIPGGKRFTLVLDIPPYLY